MSIRSKVSNTLGPDSTRPVFRKNPTAYLGPNTTGDPFVLGIVHQIWPVSATASGTYLTDVPSNTYDGNQLTNWGSGGYPPGWIYWDFGVPHPWRRVDVHWNGSGPNSYKIEGSNDASAWTVLGVYGQPSTSHLLVAHNIFDQTAYRYIRANALVAATDWLGIKDAYFWATGPSTVPWLMEDPLSTTSNLSFSGAAWDTSSGYLNIASPFSGTNHFARHSYPLNASFDRHVVEVEMRAPSNFKTSSDNHLDVGYGTTGFTAGNLFCCMLSETTTQRLGWLRAQTAWGPKTAYTWTDGRWYRMRSMWDVPTNMWSGYVDGSLVSAHSQSQSETGLYPMLCVFRSGGTGANYSFRNLKYWGGAANDTPP